jgi:hypothetical protein
LKAVTWILRILSTATFIYMCYIVYEALRGSWEWDETYVFIVIIFRLLSFIVFFLAIMIMTGLATAFLGAAPNNFLVGLYNTLLLKFWYMQPYGVQDPLTNIGDVFSNFGMNFLLLLVDLWNTLFIFLYFLAAGIGVAMFLQSLVRMEHKYVAAAFASIQCVIILAAARIFFQGATIAIPGRVLQFPSDFVAYLGSPMFTLALVSFAYLEISYQMIYSYSVGKPIEDREETLKKQLLALRQATRKQDAIEKGEKVSTTAMSRLSGATAFSFLREAIERKVLGDKDVLENLDAVSDVRRLQTFVDELLSEDPNAKDELTAKAAAPSSSYVISSTFLGTIMRFLLVLSITFVLMNPELLFAGLSLPQGIANSAEIVQPEVVLLFLVPITLVFVFVAMVLGWLSKREEIEETREERKARKQREKEAKKKRKEAEKIRKKREKERKKRKAKEGERDEWDMALEDAFRT